MNWGQFVRRTVVAIGIIIVVMLLMYVAVKLLIDDGAGARSAPWGMYVAEAPDRAFRQDPPNHRMLMKVADQYDGDVRKTAKRFVALFEPMMIVVMGGLIGAIVVSMLTAIFSLNDMPK